jgi:hypothetical protein
MSERFGYWKYRADKLQIFEKTSPESLVLGNDGAVAQIENARTNSKEPMPVGDIRDVTALSGGRAIGLWSVAGGSCATVVYRQGRWYLGMEMRGFSLRNVPNKAWFMDEKNFVAIGSDKIARCVDGKVTLQNLEDASPAQALAAVWGHDLNHCWTADLRGNVYSLDGRQWTRAVPAPEALGKEKFEALCPAHAGPLLGITGTGVYVLE